MGQINSEFDEQAGTFVDVADSIIIFDSIVKAAKVIAMSAFPFSRSKSESRSK